MNIVLAHGILGFSHLAVPLNPIDYFAGVAAFLRERFQATVIAPAVDPTAGIERRSEMLRSSIDAALRTGQLQPDQPIHIIAHSMGGLDARRMTAKSCVFEVNETTTVIQTLATIGTPHRGSPIADLVALTFLDTIPLIADAVKQPELAVARLLAHFRISLDGLHDLTSESTEHFNAANPNQPTVKYLSYAGAGRPGLVPTSNFFLPYHAFIQAKIRGREPSDGVVTISSAMWGTFDPNLWPADHADQIGHNLDLPLAKPPADTLRRYEQIVQAF